MVKFICRAFLPPKESAAPRRNKSRNKGPLAPKAPVSTSCNKRKNTFPICNGSNKEKNKCLYRDGKRHVSENLGCCDKEKESSSAEQVTPRNNPTRGSECLRRFNNEECNFHQGNKKYVESETLEGESSTRVLSEQFQEEIEGIRTVVIPDLFIPDEDFIGLEDFGVVTYNNEYITNLEKKVEEQAVIAKKQAAEIEKANTRIRELEEVKERQGRDLASVLECLKTKGYNV